jgi:hypothetical protein
MPEAVLTAAGLILGVAATLVGLLHDEKASPTRRLLSVLAILGLGAGLVTTVVQYEERVEDSKAAQCAQERLRKIQDKVGDLDQVQAALLQAQTALGTKMLDLTLLDKLGGGEYYVVIDTFKRGSATDNSDFCEVKARLLTLYPKAETSGLLWSSSLPRDSSHYQLRFGRRLTPSSAQIFLSLANQGLANGRAIIRREGSGITTTAVAPPCS